MINTNMNSVVSFGKAQKNQKSEKNHQPRTQGDNIKRVAVNTAITAGTGAAIGAVGASEVPRALMAIAGAYIKNKIREVKALRRSEATKGGTIDTKAARREIIENVIPEYKRYRKQLLSYIKDGITPQMRGTAAIRCAITAVVVGTTGSLVVHGLKDMFRTDKHK